MSAYFCQPEFINNLWLNMNPLTNVQDFHSRRHLCLVEFGDLNRLPLSSEWGRLSAIIVKCAVCWTDLGSPCGSVELWELASLLLLSGAAQSCLLSLYVSDNNKVFFGVLWVSDVSSSSMKGFVSQYGTAVKWWTVYSQQSLSEVTNWRSHFSLFASDECNKSEFSFPIK